MARNGAWEITYSYNMQKAVYSQRNDTAFIFNLI